VSRSHHHRPIGLPLNPVECGGSRGCKRRYTHSIEYTENPQEFNGVAPTDFFNTTGYWNYPQASATRPTRPNFAHWLRGPGPVT